MAIILNGQRLKVIGQLSILLNAGKQRVGIALTPRVIHVA
jgi:hypothetical protein